MSNDTATVPKSRFEIATRATILLLTVYLLIIAFNTFNFSLLTIARFPYQLDREEGFILYQAMRLADGETIYPPLDGYPYIVGNYTPLFPSIYAIAIKIAGASLGVGRLLVLIAGFATALMAAYYVWRETREWIAALLAPALFLCTWEWYDWMPFARVDIPAIAFGFAGFLMVDRGKRTLWLPVSILLFAAAFYTKQTQIIAPAAAVIWLMTQRRWKDAGILAGGLAGFCLLVGLILIAITGGQFWKHTVTYNANTFDWWQVWTWIKHLWRFNGWSLLGTAIALGTLFIGRRNSSFQSEGKRDGAIFIYLGLATVSILSIAKVGAAGNYLLEFDLVAAVAFALLVARSLPHKNPTLLTILLLFLLIHTGRTAQLHHDQLAQFRFPPPPQKNSRSTGDYLRLQVEDATGPVFSEDPIFPILAKKPVYRQSFIMTHLEIEQGIVPTKFTEDLNNAEFSLILSTQDVERDEVVVGWTPEMKETIAEHYQKVQTVPLYGKRVFYLYRKKSSENQ